MSSSAYLPSISRILPPPSPRNYPPDLQRARAQNTGALVLSHEGRCCALVVRNLLVLVRLVVALAVVGGGIGVARDDDVVLVALLTLLVGLANGLVFIGRLWLRLVVLIGILVKGGLVVAACV